MHPNEVSLLDKLDYARWVAIAREISPRHLEALVKQFDRQFWEARHAQAAPLE